MKGKRRSLFSHAMESFFTKSSSSSPPKLKRGDISSISKAIQSTSQASASKSKSNESVVFTDFQFLKKTENNPPTTEPIDNEILVNHSIKNIPTEFSEVDPPIMIFLEEPSMHKFRDESDDNNLNLSPYVSDEDSSKSETKSFNKKTNLIEELATGWESEKDDTSDVDVEKESIQEYRLLENNEVEITFNCHICGNDYETKNILEQHLKEHSIVYDQFVRNSNLPKNLVPEQTTSMSNDVLYAETISLQKGINFKNIKLNCQFCNESFVDQLSFVNHCSSTHMVRKPLKALVHRKKITLGRKQKVKGRIATDSHGK